MESLLSCCVPNLISQDAVFKAAFLRQERSSDGGFFVGLEFVGDLEMNGIQMLYMGKKLVTHEAKYD